MRDVSHIEGANLAMCVSAYHHQHCWDKLFGSSKNALPTKFKYSTLVLWDILTISWDDTIRLLTKYLYALGLILDMSSDVMVLFWGAFQELWQEIALQGCTTGVYCNVLQCFACACSPRLPYLRKCRGPAWGQAIMGFFQQQLLSWVTFFFLLDHLCLTWPPR